MLSLVKSDWIVAYSSSWISSGGWQAPSTSNPNSSAILSNSSIRSPLILFQHGLPVVHPLALKDAQGEDIHVDLPIADTIRRQREPEHVPDPSTVAVTDRVLGKGRIDLPAREHDEARTG